MVFFSSKALFACVHASALLAGSSFLPVSLAKEDMDAAILHHQEKSLRARSVGNPNTSAAAAAAAAFAVSDGNLEKNARALSKCTKLKGMINIPKMPNGAAHPPGESNYAFIRLSLEGSSDCFEVQSFFEDNLCTDFNLLECSNTSVSSSLESKSVLLQVFDADAESLLNLIKNNEKNLNKLWMKKLNIDKGSKESNGGADVQLISITDIFSTMMPSMEPSDLPSSLPSSLPSFEPSDLPSSLPSSLPSESPTNTPLLQFSMSYYHACAVYSSKVQCVGYNFFGQVSDPPSAPVTTPVPFTFPAENSASPIKVVTGFRHTCVLMDDKSVWCKGYNNNGQLGNETTSYKSLTPVQVKYQYRDTVITNAVDIEAGAYHNCIKFDDDSLYCFGSDSANQLRLNRRNNVKLMALSYYATCIVKNSALNEVVCEGESFGRFNDKFETYDMVEEIVKLVSGEGHFCVLLKSKKAKCFGRNSSGQLGNGSRSRIGSFDSAVDVLSSPNGSPLSDITDINAGQYSTCLVVSNNRPMCFGYNLYYQLGIANRFVLVPTELDGVTLQTNRGDIASIHVGRYTGHIVYQDNSVFSWGTNAYGTLGDGSDTSDKIGVTVGEDAVEMAFNWN